MEHNEFTVGERISPYAFCSPRFVALGQGVRHDVVENDAQDSDGERKNECVPEQCCGADAARDLGIPMILATQVGDGAADDRDRGECQ